MPLLSVKDEFTPSTYNPPAFANRMAEVLKSHFPEGTVSETRPSMDGEDFGRYYRADKSIESFIFWVGGVPADRMAKDAEGEISLPSLQSPFWEIGRASCGE